MTADPTLGSPASIRTAARHHASVATTTEDARARLSSAAADLDPSDWTGVARDRFSSAVTALLPALARTVALSEHVADTLDDYADAVERIQDEAARVRSAQQTAADERRRLASEQRDLTARTESDDAVESDAVRLRRVGQDLTQQDDTLTQLSARWDELVVERERLDRQTPRTSTGSSRSGSPP